MQDFVTPTSKLRMLLNPLPFEFMCTHVWVDANMQTYLIILFLLLSHWLIMGWGHKSGKWANIFGSHLVDQQFLTSLGGGNVFHTSCWGTCWPWYIFKWIHVPIGGSTIFRLFQGDKKYLDSTWWELQKYSCISLSYLPAFPPPPQPVIGEYSLTFRTIIIKYVLLNIG